MNTKEIQKTIYENKVKHGFNLTNIHQEFCYIYGETGEAYMAWLKKQDDVGEELADVAIYLLGLAEMLNIDLGKEVERKIEINKNRVYKENSKGVLVKEDELK